MSEYDPSVICDYVTVFTVDAANHPESDMDEGRLVWDIPPHAYYFKDRGSVCLMSIADGTLPRQVGENVIVMTQQGFNGMTAQEDSGTVINSDLAVLATFINSRLQDDHIVTKYLSPQPIKLLTPAKPKQIKVQFMSMEKTAVDMSSTTLSANGTLTFKFEYFNPERLNNGLYSQEYKPAWD